MLPLKLDHFVRHDIVDINQIDPRDVDFVIPANDDASKSVEKILSLVTQSVAVGLKNRQAEKDAENKGKEDEAAAKAAPAVEVAPVAEAAPVVEAPVVETPAAEVPTKEEGEAPTEA